MLINKLNREVGGLEILLYNDIGFHDFVNSCILFIEASQKNCLVQLTMHMSQMEIRMTVDYYGEG